MFKIIALNADSETDGEHDEEILVTKEAEETIAISEYLRALSFKSNNKNEDAMILFNELLETRVLNEISFADKDDKLFCIRYNCHKNIAIIHEENSKEQLALEHYIKAMELDDTEVYTMYRFGQLSLKLKQWELAQYAYHKCLLKNPNHWPSADGILQCLCNTSNIMAAYGWALKWYLKDSNYTRATDVLTEISKKFPDIIPFFQSVWKNTHSLNLSTMETKKSSVFAECDVEIHEPDTDLKKPNLNGFQVDSLNWVNVGNFIVALYNHLLETKQSILFVLNLQDLYKEKTLQSNGKENDSEHLTKDENDDYEMRDLSPEANPETKDKDIQNIDLKSTNTTVTDIQSDSNAEDSDNSKLEVSETIRKPRRRCSDLSFLEQWGWHKNRRYSSRKKSQQDRPDIDNSLKAFLKRMFIQYFDENYDNESPFLKDVKPEQTVCKKTESDTLTSHCNLEEFEKKTDTDFLEFVNELKSEKFDVILLIYKWLKYIAKYWNQVITDQVKTLYHQIYSFYLNHFDLATWNNLSNNAFKSSYQMALFYLELSHEQTILAYKSGSHEIDTQWRIIYHHLMFNSGAAYVIEDENYKSNIIRLIWQDYCLAKLENDLHRSVECLQHLEYLIENQYSGIKFELKLPNLKENNSIELDNIRTTRINLQRKISLNNVKNLYENKNYKELVNILKESFVNSTEIKNSDNTAMKIQTQFEVLLESIWNLDDYNDCFVWSERCLNYAVNNLLAAPTDTHRYEEWAESVNFILIYVEELILRNNDIVLSVENYLARLIQSIVKILTHQFDVPFDKNNNPIHPVNTKRPWVILHQILQRNENNSPVVIKVKPMDIQQNDIEENLEDLLPHTFLLLFTAHEFLGRRQWCTRDNGQLLIYTLEMVLPKLRAPYMDAYRDLIIEYLEQITYCLYGYPAKKARSRHIEEHDSVSVDLTWKRAIQLFELYRPESLPEFNSYKLDSITADMEQLLLKIVLLIPKEIDPCLQTTEIHNFINGITDKIPQACNFLPQRISCIYYLLADYYFKNGDFQRTIKYYVLDLTCEPSRFDSWAGIALSKASKLETKFNSCIILDYKDCLKECENALRCFEECIKLNRNHTLIWIEYGSFAYTIHSFCSRYMKHSLNTLSMDQFALVESSKEKYLKISSDCFIIANKPIKAPHDINESDDSHDEKWLHHFMLGKIAEKQKEHPKIYLDHYLIAANLLFESNATYPIKINHNTPQTLSIEALEIFYRTSSSIIKYLELHTEVTREIGKLFMKVLKDLAASPFSLNQAKIDDSSINALKRKLAVEKESACKKPCIDNIIETSKIINEVIIPIKIVENTENRDKIDVNHGRELAPPPPVVESKVLNRNPDKFKDIPKFEEKRSHTPNVISELKQGDSSSRRGSQESSATTATTTTGTGCTSTTSSSSSSVDSSTSESTSSDSDSGASSSDDDNAGGRDNKNNEHSIFSQSQLESIYQKCVKNLEECATRFPEHYKSIYRLTYHYLNAPDKLRNIEKCVQLLLGTYKTALGNQIIGLFAERKNNNFFNGIWRIPSSEIDRPGSFETHLVKCVHLLLEVLRKDEDHKMLIDLALQLHRTPDNDKRYIKDSERKELYKQAIAYGFQVMREILKRNNDTRNDEQVLNLIIDIYKSHKKCVKHMNQKEPIFTQLLVQAYKFYIQDKVAKMPENANLIDLAIKLCVQEIAQRKNLEKYQAMQNSSVQSFPGVVDTQPPFRMAQPTTSTTNDIIPNCSGNNSSSSLQTVKPVQIPGLSNRPRGRPVGSKNTATPTIPNLNQNYVAGLGLMDSAAMATLIALYNNPAMGPQLTKDPKYMNDFFSEYYKFLAAPGGPPILPQNKLPTNNISNSPKDIKLYENVLQQQTIIPQAQPPPKVPQYDIKNLIASAASQVAQTTAQSPSATISIGSGQLTITPTASKPSPIPAAIKENLGGRSNSPKVYPQHKPNSSISLSKVTTGTNSVVGGISVKPLSDLTSPKPPPPQSSPNLSHLSSLPKSLTITRTISPSGDKTNKNFQCTSIIQSTQPKTEKKFSGGKAKTNKKTIYPNNSYPVSASTNLSVINTATDSMFSMATGQPSLLGAASFGPNLSEQASLLKSYAEMLESAGLGSNMQLLSQIAKFPMPPTIAQQQQQLKRPYQKRGKTPKSPSLPPTFNATGAALLPPVRSNSSKPQQKAAKPPQIPFAQPTYIPLLSHLSQIPSRPKPNVAAHFPTNQISPTKTLQQKLAEKQKANQMMESGNNARVCQQNVDTKTKKTIPEVIILD